MFLQNSSILLADNDSVDTDEGIDCAEKSCFTFAAPHVGIVNVKYYQS